MKKKKLSANDNAQSSTSLPIAFRGVFLELLLTLG
jgi:hypothetical protein